MNQGRGDIKTIKLSVLFIILSITFTLEASADFKDEEFQRSFYEIGFKEVQVALQEAEDHFKKEMALPVQIPPIEFTHSFGRFINLRGMENDEFEMEYRHIDKPENHYMISIKPANYGVPIRKELIDQVMILKDGSKAIYSMKAVNGFNLFRFEKNGWQYVLYINQAVSRLVPLETLLDIANSVSGK